MVPSAPGNRAGGGCDYNPGNVTGGDGVAKPRVTVRDVRRVNRAALLRPLFLSGPLNRVELGELTGLSSASITNVVADLLDEGLIAEAGTEESDGGRRRVLLKMNSDFGAIVGINISENDLFIELYDLSMRSLVRQVVPMRPADHPIAVVVNELERGIKEVLAQSPVPSGRVIGVGVSVPGAVEHGREYLVHAPNVGWKGVPLAKLLADAVGLPILVENDAKAFGQAEMWFGAGRGTKDSMIASIRDGVGAALFNDASLYHGFASSAGEWGHMCVVAGGRRCRCGARGCLEAYVGANALIEQWVEEDGKSRRVRPGEGEKWVKRLVTADATSPVAARLLNQTATYLGIAAANIVNLVSPERIVIGGWAGLLLGPLVLPRMREVLFEQALEYPASHVSVELGQLGSDSEGLAASTLVVSELLASGGRLDATRARTARSSRDRDLTQHGRGSGRATSGRMILRDADRVGGGAGRAELLEGA
jgi:predicted NBD/HSP70 family sugar kinase